MPFIGRHHAVIKFVSIVLRLIYPSHTYMKIRDIEFLLSRLSLNKSHILFICIYIHYIYINLSILCVFFTLCVHINRSFRLVSAWFPHASEGHPGCQELARNTFLRSGGGGGIFKNWKELIVSSYD